MIIAFHQSTIIRRQSKPFQKLTKSSKSNNAEAKVLIYMSCKHIYFHFIRPVDDPASFHSLVSFILRWLWFILIILAPRPLLDLFLIWRSLRSLSAWAFFRFGFFWQSVEFCRRRRRRRCCRGPCPFSPPCRVIVAGKSNPKKKKADERRITPLTSHFVSRANFQR